MIHRSVQKKSSTEIGGRLLKRKNSSLIERAARQVFPRCQPANQWCQLANQWWQLELPLQRDSSFQSPQAAGSWELDLSQE